MQNNDGPDEPFELLGRETILNSLAELVTSNYNGCLNYWVMF